MKSIVLMYVIFEGIFLQLPLAFSNEAMFYPEKTYRVKRNLFTKVIQHKVPAIQRAAIEENTNGSETSFNDVESAILPFLKTTAACP